MAQQQQQQTPNMVPLNNAGVPSVVVAQGAQLPAALMAGHQLSAQQLHALATSGGALLVPGIPGVRLPLQNVPIADMMLPPGLTLPTAVTTASIQQQAPPDAAAMMQLAGYRDYSRMVEDCAPPIKDHSFPMKLHKILSCPKYSEFITWLPHGRSWRVLKPKAVRSVKCGITGCFLNRWPSSPSLLRSIV